MQTDGRKDGQTDRHDEANSRFSQLRKPALPETSGFRQNTLPRDTTARVLQTCEVLKKKKLHSVFSGL